MRQVHQFRGVASAARPPGKGAAGKAAYQLRSTVGRKSSMHCHAVPSCACARCQRRRYHPACSAGAVHAGARFQPCLTLHPSRPHSNDAERRQRAGGRSRLRGSGSCAAAARCRLPGCRAGGAGPPRRACVERAVGGEGESKRQNQHGGVTGLVKWLLSHWLPSRCTGSQPLHRLMPSPRSSAECVQRSRVCSPCRCAVPRRVCGGGHWRQHHHRHRRQPAGGAVQANAPAPGRHPQR